MLAVSNHLHMGISNKSRILHLVAWINKLSGEEIPTEIRSNSKGAYGPINARNTVNREETND